MTSYMCHMPDKMAGCKCTSTSSTSSFDSSQSEKKNRCKITVRRATRRVLHQLRVCMRTWANDCSHDLYVLLNNSFNSALIFKVVYRSNDIRIYRLVSDSKQTKCLIYLPTSAYQSTIICITISTPTN